MRYFPTFILLFLSSNVFPQINEEKAIDSIVQNIKNTSHSETIKIKNNPEDNILSSLGIENETPISIIGYFNKDTLLKTIAKYENSSRIKTTYYKYSQQYIGNAEPIYIRDYDSISNKLLVEMYLKDYDIISSNMKKSIEEKSEFLFNSTFPSEMRHVFNMKHAKKYTFKGKLVEEVSQPPDCGYFAFAVMQKFKVISTTYPDYDKKYVLIAEQCPDFLPKNFFKKNKVYQMEVSTYRMVEFQYIVFENKYKDVDLPTFWSMNTKKVE